jgi:hypothetical protein
VCLLLNQQDFLFGFVFDLFDFLFEFDLIGFFAALLVVVVNLI